MKTVITVLALMILALIAYKLWKPIVAPPKRTVPTGSASMYFFYTDWCGFSQKAMPEWENLEAKLADTPYFGKTKVTAVRVDADKDVKTAGLYEITAYPTILLETKDGIYPYSKRPTTDALFQFLRESLGKESSSL